MVGLHVIRINSPLSEPIDSRLNYFCSCRKSLKLTQMHISLGQKKSSLCNKISLHCKIDCMNLDTATRIQIYEDTSVSGGCG